MISINFKVICELEEIPYQGNCSACDPETDQQVEKWVADQLAQGNEWAWCFVRVVCTISDGEHNWQGIDTLGGCAYKSEEDFKAGGYYEDMLHQAREMAEGNLRYDVARGEAASKVLRGLLVEEA